MSSARRRWFDLLCRDVLQLAGSSADVARAYVPVRHRPLLGAATLVAWICRSASIAMTTPQIVERLLASGALGDCGQAVTTDLVRQVRVEWGNRGLPIADWWSPNRLLGAMSFYLAPRIAFESGAEEARKHLRLVFGLTDERVIAAMAAEPMDPIPHPVSPIRMEIDAHGGQAGGLAFLAYLGHRPELLRHSVKAREHSLLRDGRMAHPGDWQLDECDREADEWLVEGQASLVMWQALHQLLKTWPEGPGGELVDVGRQQLAEARSIAAEKWRRCRQWRLDLTEPEQALLRSQDSRWLRRRRWLDAHLRTHYMLYQAPDSVPDSRATGASSMVPAWVAMEVFDLGARVIRRTAGPIEFWGVVLESDEEEAEATLLSDGVGRLTVENTDGRVVIYMAVGRGEWKNAMLVPFYYHLDESDGAVQLLVASLVGVRLDFYRLREERELVHLAGALIQLPVETLRPLLDRIDETLLRAEESEPDASPLFSLSRAPDQAPLMFIGADRAKSEEILFDLGLSAGDEHQIRAVQEARSVLAAAEEKRVTVETDGHNDALILSGVAHARSIYRRRRQEAYGGQRDDNLADLTTNVVGPGRAFVHLAEFGDDLACLIAVHDGEKPQVRKVDLGHVGVARLRRVCGLWLDQQTEASPEQRAAALDAVLEWVSDELVSPLVEAVGNEIHHLVLSPSRLLEPIPLHACGIGGGTLDDLYRVSYAPSAAVVRVLATRQDGPHDLDLVVAASGADAPADLGVEVLDGPGQEARALSVLAPDAQLLEGPSAQPATVLDAVADAHVAHIAAHGWSRPDALASGLWLAGETRGQSLLSAARVHAGPPLTKTSLVVLSACETARHPVVGRTTQAWRGLDSAFLARGVRAVVSTLWEIDDVVALVYGVTFHRHLSSGDDIIGAHSKAVAGLRNGIDDARIQDILDQVRPSWRTDLSAIDASRAIVWSSYRLSGVCWPRSGCSA